MATIIFNVQGEIQQERPDLEAIKHRFKHAISKHISEDDIELTETGLYMRGFLHGCGFLSATVTLTLQGRTLTCDMRGNFTLGIYGWFVLVLGLGLAPKYWDQPWPYFCFCIFIIMLFRWWYKLEKPRDYMGEAFQAVVSEHQ